MNARSTERDGSNQRAQRPSVHHVAVHQIVHHLKMRNLEGSHRLDGQHEALIGTTSHIRGAQTLPCRPQGAKHSRPVESLPFAVVAEAHRVVSRLPRVLTGVSTNPTARTRPALPRGSG